MALVECKECGKSISSLAQTCPHCGIHRGLQEPLTKNATPVQTVQETSKYLKGWLAIGYIITLYGLYRLFTIGSIEAISAGTEASPAWIFLLGLISVIITKLCIWWNHK